MSRSGTHYERAFESYLQDHRIRYVAVDQARKALFAGAKIKSFDFIVYPHRGQTILADVKGRKLTTRAFERKGAGQSWVTMADITGLRSWEEVFGPEHVGVFVFVYWLFDSDGQTRSKQIFRYPGREYLFMVAELCGYQLRMKARSAKWRTVFVPAGPFQDLAQPFEQFIKG